MLNKLIHFIYKVKKTMTANRLRVTNQTMIFTSYPTCLLMIGGDCK